ncbi:MAG: zinc ribbon domain-containing protein [Oscillospiraceae bacterium]|nr:zinc ribbon domain-containing protein [Oscillospiraceae bacterium]
MICPKCGTTVSETETTCPQCGQTIRSVVTNAAPSANNQGNIPAYASAPKQPAQPVHTAKPSPVPSILLLLSCVVGALYFAYLAYIYLDGASTAANSSGWDALGMMLQQVLLLPHTVAILCAVILNFFGFCLKDKGFGLSGAILYTVAIALFPLYFQFVIVEAVLSYIGYALLARPVRQGNGSHPKADKSIVGKVLLDAILAIAVIAIIYFVMSNR